MLHAMLAQYKTIHTNYDPVQVLLYCIGHLGGKDLERGLTTLKEQCKYVLHSVAVLTHLSLGCAGIYAHR